MVAVVFGSLGALIGLALLLLAGLALVLEALARDDDGYHLGHKASGDPHYALTVEDIDLGSDPVDFVPKDVLGRVRIRAERLGGGAVFIGIGPERRSTPTCAASAMRRSRICPMTRRATYDTPGQRARSPPRRSSSGSPPRRGRDAGQSAGRSRRTLVGRSHER